MIRVALYARVSSEEQAIKGFSIGAQLDDLRRYAKRNTLKIVGEYVDEGISARKKWQKRDAFVRMMDDVKDGKIDLILFIKLDRWFRSVPDYYEVQRILDECHVDWKCTQEEYDTTTANGKLMLNLKLAIAQDEADRTSERIKFVQENKVRNGEVITGSVHYGFYIDRSDGRKRIAIDKEKMKVVKDAFAYFHKTHNYRKTRFYIESKYGIAWTYQTFRAMLFNDMYFGAYRGNNAFCEAAFDRAYIEDLRRIGTVYKGWTRNVKHVYLFGGLLRCPECGSKMSGTQDRYKGEIRNVYYRCPKHYNHHACGYNLMVNEKTAEKYLLDHIERELAGHVIVLKDKEEKKEDNKKAIEALHRKLDRLNFIYMTDRCDQDFYQNNYEEIQKAIEELTPKKKKDPKEIKTLVVENLGEIYKDFTREEKRTVWRSILESIEIDSETKTPTPIFL